VILVDANILIYAHIKTTSRHEVARTWLDARLNGSARVGLPWESLLAFLRVVTNPRVYPRPTPVSDAVGQMTAWLGCETAWIPQPTERHADVLVRLLSLPGIRGKLIPDAHLAALAIEHGLTLCSADVDFARFAELRWENPLAS
jgi:toxin-antitoxin system PIN domain toxin